ncbi:MAG: hypothetical protein KDK12_16030 [Rhodobacteraceae bacterium]|nr:hypothetical protein [Paracoccaceae bacterium]
MLRSLLLALALLAPAASGARTLYAIERTLGYEAPDFSSRAILRANACAALNAVGRSGEWVLVESGLGRVAYVPIRALSTTRPNDGPALRLTAHPGVRQAPRRCA